MPRSPFPDDSRAVAHEPPDPHGDHAMPDNHLHDLDDVAHEFGVDLNAPVTVTDILTADDTRRSDLYKRADAGTKHHAAAVGSVFHAFRNLSEYQRAELFLAIEVAGLTP